MKKYIQMSFSRPDGVESVEFLSELRCKDGRGKERRMRLIDADAVEKITWQDPSYTDPLNVLTEVREKVRALPTIDAVPVIRCKDCKHWLPHTQFGYDADYEEYHNYCNRHLPDDDFYAFIKEAEDYCSWAERREE